MRCKLPHVIRANQRRTAEAGKSTTSGSDATASVTSTGVTTVKSPETSGQVYVEDGNIGDEFISLTFHESENSEEEDGNDSGASDSEEGAGNDGEEDDESEDDQNTDDAGLQVHP